jgi:hypothetical protein
MKKEMEKLVEGIVIGVALLEDDIRELSALVSRIEARESKKDGSLNRLKEKPIMKETLQAKDIANEFGIALGKAYELMRRNDFPTIRITKRRMIVTREALNRWIAEQEIKPK